MATAMEKQNPNYSVQMILVTSMPQFPVHPRKQIQYKTVTQMQQQQQFKQTSASWSSKFSLSHSPTHKAIIHKTSEHACKDNNFSFLGNCNLRKQSLFGSEVSQACESRNQISHSFFWKPQSNNYKENKLVKKKQILNNGKLRKQCERQQLGKSPFAWRHTISRVYPTLTTSCYSLLWILLLLFSVILRSIFFFFSFLR